MFIYKGGSNGKQGRSLKRSKNNPEDVRIKEQFQLTGKNNPEPELLQNQVQINRVLLELTSDQFRNQYLNRFRRQRNRKVKKGGLMMKDIERDATNVDQLGENITIQTETEGLSVPEGEEAGDFEGNGQVQNNKGERKIKEGKGSAGSMLYEPDFNDIDTGTSGSNSRKYTNYEKTGSGEADIASNPGKTDRDYS